MSSRDIASAFLISSSVIASRRQAAFAATRARRSGVKVEGGVHVKMTVDERRREQISPRVDLLSRLDSDSRLGRRGASGGDRNVLALASVWQRRIAQNRVKMHGPRPVRIQSS
jgi:hypothetical protein